jgi:2-polyprenyl-6-methoxyphenol hydroxylase-like FAD-dependent oxidoreductase
MVESARKAVVIGAGPVGCLTAISLAKMGWQVEVYEGRPGTPQYVFVHKKLMLIHCVSLDFPTTLNVGLTCSRYAATIFESRVPAALH